MSRLFILGDSWAFNYFSSESKHRPELSPHLKCDDVYRFVKEFNFYGHWTDYLGESFEIHNYSEPATSIEEVIHQIGFIPKYIDGDRIIMMFPIPNRYQWIYKNRKTTSLIDAYWFDELTNTELQFHQNQLINRLDSWVSGERNLEKRFIEKLDTLLKDYNPILTSWDFDMCNDVNNIKFIPLSSEFKSITDESGGKYVDGHLGVKGNYLLYKFIGNELGIDTEKIKFTNTFDKKII